MWEACVSITALSAGLMGLPSIFVPTGFPLAGALIGACWFLQLLPSSVYPLVGGGPSDVLTACQTVVMVDLVQYGLHRLSHVYWKASHGIHHVHTKPTRLDAFNTGVLDGIYQLITPIIVVAWVVRPSRAAITLFGAFYSLWLQEIHSTTSRIEWLAPYFVTSAYHRVHHAHPQKNFGHVLTLWDHVGGTHQTVAP